jgi:hypothetical protein
MTHQPAIGGPTALTPAATRPITALEMPERAG